MNKALTGCLVFAGIAGLTAYHLGIFAPKETLADSQDVTTIEVTPTVVDVSKLEKLSSKDVSRSRSKLLLPSPRIPGGRDRLARIKRNPLSTPAGRAAAKANLKIKPLSLPLTAKATRAQPRVPTQTYNCVGNVTTGFAPSDSHGTVGLNHYVEVTNVDLGIYSKTSCTTNRFVSLKSFFKITDAATIAFDPRAIYDFRNNRYVVTTETSKSGSDDQFQYFAVSRTGNPLGKWNVYTIALSKGTTKFCKKLLTDFWDYPNLGYNKDQWFITANNFPAAGGFYGAIMTINKAETLAGQPAVLRCYGAGSNPNRQIQANVAPPLNRGNGSTAYFLATGSGSGTQLLKYTLNTSTGAMTYNTPIAIPAWTAPPDAPQPTTSLLLDTIDGRFQSNTTQIGKLVFGIHAINVSGLSAIRLYQVDAANDSAVERFTATGGSNAVWGPSFALRDNAGTTSGFFAVSISGAAQNPVAALYGVRNDLVGGAFGFTYETGVPMTSNCQNVNRCRWGDYSATSLDPANLNSAFGVAQYMTAGSQSNWSTKIMGLAP